MKTLETARCPFCFSTTHRPGFTGPCPKCGKDTGPIINAIRNRGPVRPEDQEAYDRIPKAMKTLKTTQCPFCFYTARGTGFTGLCPKCGKDTSPIMNAIRNRGPVRPEDQEAYTRLQSVLLKNRVN
jgi:hypothetical protein